MRASRTAKCALVAAGLACAAIAHGQSKEAWPGRPVRIVVPQTPGASTDLTARLIAQRLTSILGQPVIVENRPGAGSIVGTELVAKATPDGHTLLVVASSITLNPIIHKNLPFDPQRDLTPITQLSSFPNMLVVNPTLPVKSVQDLIALAKAKPGALNYGSAGTATGTHLSAELFKYMTGTDMVHVPYKGGGAAMPALIGGQVQLMFSTTVTALPHVRAGRLRAIAVTSGQRWPSLPEIPTIAESGVPGYDHTPWNGFLAPAKTPRNIISRLNEETAKILHLPETRSLLPAKARAGRQQAARTSRRSSSRKRRNGPRLVKAAGIQAD